MADHIKHVGSGQTFTRGGGHNISSAGSTRDDGESDIGIYTTNGKLYTGKYSHAKFNMLSRYEKKTLFNNIKVFEGRDGGGTRRVQRKVVVDKFDDNTKKIANLKKNLKVAHRKIGSMQTTKVDDEVKEEEPLAQPSGAGTAFGVRSSRRSGRR